MKYLLIIGLIISIAGCQSNKTKSGDSNSSPPDKSNYRALMISYGVKPKNPEQSELDKFPLGSAENPIRVNGPQGEHDYISRLVCMNGEPVSSWERLGSGDDGPYGFILDIYSVICDTNNGVVKKTLFMDMYHGDNVEIRPADGFIELKKD